MVVCDLCKHRVLRHSRKLECYICQKYFHLRCLPNTVITEDRQWMCHCCCAEIFPFNRSDDDNEYRYNVNSFFNDLNHDPQHNNPLLFNPFDMNDESLFLPLHDVDPDFNFYNEMAEFNSRHECKYYLEKSFNRNLGDQADNAFSILHLNIRSIPKNLGNFTSFISNLNLKFAFIGLSETWLNENNCTLYNMDGYNKVDKYRINRTGGGVSLYIRNDIQFIERPDLSEFNENIESLSIEISKDVALFERNVVILLVYRPPNTDISVFNVIVNNTLNKIKYENKICYILGDFNINLLNQDTHLGTSDFLDTLYTNAMFPLITRPTRIQRNSATLIDNIFSNSLETRRTYNGLLVTDISDHYPIFSIELDKTITAQPEYVKKRIYSQRNKDRFLQLMSEFDRNQIMNCHNSSEAFSHFHVSYKKIYELCFPVKTYKFGYKNRKSWISEGLKKSIRVKNQLYMILKSNPNEINVKTYKEYKCKLSRLLKQAERQHYDKLFELNKCNMRKSWQIMKTIINKKKTSNMSNKFIVNGQLCSCKQQITNAFNNFFVNIGTNLSKKIPPTNVNPLSYMENLKVNQSIYLSPTSEQEVNDILKTIKTNSTGWDDLHADIIKSSSFLVIDIIVHLINLTLTQGSFPDELKIARVLPLYKSGDATVLRNYRPVSILPVFSKIFEKVIYRRLIEFVNRHNILYSHQYGFRMKYNTTMALITLTDKIVSGFNNNNMTLGTFLDFSKAFDTIDHKILLDKLKVYGIRGTANDLIHSYLSNRKQFTSFDNTYSNMASISCGVPQGSILGPLLFILYINDIYMASNKTFFILFADDSSVFVQGKNVAGMSRLLNEELEKIRQWINCNKLSLNVDKTHCMLFKQKQARQTANVNVKIEGKMIENVKVTKFLGIMIDCNLSWGPHIEYIRKKIAKGIAVIAKTRKTLNSNALVTLYYSFIYPYIHYAIELWGAAPKTNLLPILLLQKRVLRLISFENYRASSQPLFESHRILDIHKVYIYKVALFMIKFTKDDCPDYFDAMFVFNQNQYNYETRQHNRLHVPYFRTRYGQSTIRYKGVIIFNHVSRNLNCTLSILSIKKHLKKYLLNNNDDNLPV